MAAINEMMLQSHISGFLFLLPAWPQALGEVGFIRGLRARGDLHVSMSWEGGAVKAAIVRFNSPHPWLSGLEETFEGSGFFVAADGREKSKRGGASGDGGSVGAGGGSSQQENEYVVLAAVAPNPLVVVGESVARQSRYYSKARSASGGAGAVAAVPGYGCFAPAAVDSPRSPKGQSETADNNDNIRNNSFYASSASAVFGKLPIHLRQGRMMVALHISSFPCEAYLCASHLKAAACIREISSLS